MRVYVFGSYYSAHEWSACYHTDADIVAYNGDWAAWARANGHRNTFHIGTFDCLPGETADACFGRLIDECAFDIGSEKSPFSR